MQMAARLGSLRKQLPKLNKSIEKLNIEDNLNWSGKILALKELGTASTWIKVYNRCHLSLGNKSRQIYREEQEYWYVKKNELEDKWR